MKNSNFDKIVKKITALCICFIFVVSTGTNAFALTVNAKAAVLMDTSNGQILFEQNADEPLRPGSMAKLMTAYIILDQVRQGNISLNTPVTINKKTSALSKNRGYSNVPLQANQTYTMNQLLESIIIVSACGSAKAVAEYFSGNEAAFSQRMNHYAQSMGLQATFADSTGISANNYITARSMAILSKRLITDFPSILNYTKKPTLTFAGKTYEGSNRMLPGKSQYYWGADGLKTGFIYESKHCFAGTAQIADVRFVSVVMGAETLFDRFDETRKLLDYGFEKENIQSPLKHAWAIPGASQLLIDGQAIPFETYDIEGSHYLKLRDLAVALNETTKQFNVEWNTHEQAILLNTKNSYQPIGGELSACAEIATDSVAINSKIYVDGTRVRLKGYNINGTYFFNLRDVAKAINTSVIWNSATQTIGLDTATASTK
ncbi:MAG: serine hydrolase [Anaerovorax sp.]